MKTIDPTDVEAGGYEADRGLTGEVLWDEPVDPPFRWSDKDKVEATLAGLRFCWWCGVTKTLIGIADSVTIHEGGGLIVERGKIVGQEPSIEVTHLVMKKGCRDHVDNVRDVLNAHKA